MRQKQRGFVPIIVLIAVVVLVGVSGTAYYVYSSNQPKEELVSYSQPENQYSGWQEYVNPKYNYSIKYPADWFFHKTGYNPPPPAAIELSNVDENLGEVGNEIRIDISSLPAEGENLETNAEIKLLTGQGYDKKSITVSGKTALKLEKPDNEGGVESTIYVYHKDNVYRISWHLWNSEIQRLYEGQIQKIIDSFTFTD